MAARVATQKASAIRLEIPYAIGQKQLRMRHAKNLLSCLQSDKTKYPAGILRMESD